MLRGLYLKYCPEPLRSTLSQIRKRIKRVDFGALNRTTPYSKKFGYDRGGPVDRVYIERFLQKNSPYVKGRVLEIADNEYTKRFGGEKVDRSDILHIDHNNPGATIVGDLTNLSHVEDGAFDCIILTQTLHLIYDFREALKTCRRILKPGGCLLVTVPGITNIDHNEWGKYFYYSFTTHLIEKTCEEIFPGDDSEIEYYGNVKTATAFLYGLGADEIPLSSYQFQDQHYQVVVTLRLIKKN